MNIELRSAIIMQTAAEWAVDFTIYPDHKILATSDLLYAGTDQPRFKFADGVNVWSSLDYVPAGSTTNFFTGDITQTGNRVHLSAGYNVAIKNTSGWAINDDVQPNTMLRVYSNVVSGTGINSYTDQAGARALNFQADGINSFGIVGSAGGAGGIGGRFYGNAYGGWFQANSGVGTYGLLAEGELGSGAIRTTSYTLFDASANPHPSGNASFVFQGYGITGGEMIAQWRDGSGNQLFRIMGDGLVAADNIIQSDAFYVGAGGVAAAAFPECRSEYSSGISHVSRGEIGVNYISHHFTTDSAVTTAGARLIEVDNFGSVRFSIDKDGHMFLNGLYDNPTGLSSGQVFTEDQMDGTAILKIKL